MIHILVVHGDVSVHEQFRTVLQGERDLTVTSGCASLEQARAMLDRTPCDVALVSATIGLSEVLSFIRYVAESKAPSRVIVTDLTGPQEAILHLLEEGAAGYVCEHESWAELVKKIRAVHEDEFLLPPEIAASLISRIAELKQLVNELDGGGVLTKSQEAYAELTQREWEVLRLIAQDMSNQAIAEVLTIELGTVKNHVHNLLRKLDVCSRKQAAQLAQQMLGERSLSQAMALEI
jgi:DNA-binding NarL/FixJ family response regulator